MDYYKLNGFSKYTMYVKNSKRFECSKRAFRRRLQSSGAIIMITNDYNYSQSVHPAKCLKTRDY